jgi:hypothetical protein
MWNMEYGIYISANNIGGMTLHRFAGVGLGHDSVDQLVEQVLGEAVIGC